MAKWRPLEEYTPFARLLVEYMWGQRPPLLPNQFAERMGVRKQAVSTWFNSEATPPPQTAVRLARQMGLPVAEVLEAAGHATASDPLLDRSGAFELAIAEIERLGDAIGTAEQRAAALDVLRRLRDAHAIPVAAQMSTPAGDGFAEGRQGVAAAAGMPPTADRQHEPERAAPDRS